MQASKIGTIVMPIMVHYVQDTNYNPLVAFGIMGVLACIIIYFLPEIKMRDFIVEMERPLLSLSNEKKKNKYTELQEIDYENESL
mmetsp:Transcript_16896/g.14782  ORF Transcript_16896/g.14782 Transcript_16896/m.14782 type:complete len:85 (-) Transcript_16896:59-313(-)